MIPEVISFAPKDEKQWATYCEGRYPKFKIHTNIGHAHNAINYHSTYSEVGLYRYDMGEWVLDTLVPKAQCAECGKQGYGMHVLDYKTAASPKWSNLLYCYQCKQKVLGLVY